MAGIAATTPSGDSRQRPLVMIVDDDREQAEQIATFLSRFGISVTGRQRLRCGEHDAPG